MESLEKSPNPEKKTFRILFIGNSYTFMNNLPKTLEALVNSAGEAFLKTKTVAFGGYTLERHWNENTATNLIKQENWDYVILQEQSHRPVNQRERMHAYIRKFDELIRSFGGKTVLFMTWADQGNPNMTWEIQEAYTTIGKELDIVVAPLGLAWHKALEQRPELALYTFESHPNSQGVYLNACVFYYLLISGDLGGIPTIDGQPKDRDAFFLQRIARETLQDYE